MLRQLLIRSATLFPWLRPGNGQSAADGDTDPAEMPGVPGRPDLATSSQQLIWLCHHYMANHPDRTCVLGGKKEQIPRREEILRGPRMLAFADVSPGLKLTPAAAGFGRGRVTDLSGPLAEKLRNPKENPPDNEYTEEPWSSEPARQEKDFWRWFESNWKRAAAVSVIEDAATAAGTRPQWVSYHAMLSSSDKESGLHLDVRGHGGYDTGMYSRDLVWRGYRYGLRIIGTLKSGPAINVLAIYER